MSGAEWMLHALEQARLAEGLDEVPVGAVIVQGDRVVGRGHNLRESQNNPVAHAEVMAILEASRELQSWRLNGCTLYVTLEPCPMCLAACQQARIDRVIYGARDPKGGALSLEYRLHQDTRTNHRFPVDFAEAPECSQILKDFFQRKRARQKA